MLLLCGWVGDWGTLLSALSCCAGSMMILDILFMDSAWVICDTLHGSAS